MISKRTKSNFFPLKDFQIKSLCEKTICLIYEIRVEIENATNFYKINNNNNKITLI